MQFSKHSHWEVTASGFTIAISNHPLPLQESVRHGRRLTRPFRSHPLYYYSLTRLPLLVPHAESKDGAHGPYTPKLTNVFLYVVMEPES